MSATNVFDVQPWVPIAAFAFWLLVRKPTRPTIQSILLLFLILGIFIVVNFKTPPLTSIRMISAILIFYFCFFASLYSNQPDQIMISLKYSNVVYVLAGLIQLMISNDVFSFMVEVRTTDSRGVTSLATEPTFFGMVLVLYSFAYLILEKRIAPLVIVNAIVILLIAKSATAFIGLSIMFAGYVLSSWSFRKTVLSFIAVVMMFIVSHYLLTNFYFGRISILYTSIISDPFIVFEADRSAQIRLNHIISSWLISMENYLVPVPEHEISIRRFTSISQLSTLDLAINSDSDKTSSYLGSFLIPFGAMFIVASILITIKLSNNAPLPICVSLYIVLLLSVPPSLPLVPIILGLAIRPRETQNA
jgi:hypothetical protein